MASETDDVGAALAATRPGSKRLPRRRHAETRGGRDSGTTGSGRGKQDMSRMTILFGLLTCLVVASPAQSEFRGMRQTIHGMT